MRKALLVTEGLDGWLRSTLRFRDQLNRAVVFSVCIVMLVFCVLPSAWAQSEQFYPIALPTSEDMVLAEDCRDVIAAQFTAAGLVKTVDDEIETQALTCVEDLSNPNARDACMLAVARRSVNWMVFVETELRGPNSRKLMVELFSAGDGGSLLSALEVLGADASFDEVRTHCEGFANSMLAAMGYAYSAPDEPPTPPDGVIPPPPPSNPAVVHVVSVTPSPASFYVNGQEVGTAPGQFEVPAGVATSVELRSPGYTPWTQTVTVSAGATERVSNVTLVALPATLQLTANVQGGEIVVDGAVVGSTMLNRAVSVSVPSGNRQVSVRLEGFDEYRSQVTLSPGATQSLTATLSATPVGPPPAPSGFVYIAPGTFMMGSPGSEEGRDDDETQHSVTLTRGFYLQTTEVTQGEWQRVMGSNPSYFTSCGSDCPVDQVSWLDAVGYANALSRAEGLSECYDSSGNVRGGGSIYTCAGYRLPTEAEWEYAARAGTSTTTYAGAMRILGLNNATVLSDIAWYGGNSGVSYAGGYDCSGFEDRAVPSAPTCGPHQVGTQDPNAWGLYDTLGNVWEWTHDWYGDYASNSTDPAGASNGSYRIFRGGSWINWARRVRAADRNAGTPDSRLNFVGFRLARSN